MLCKKLIYYFYLTKNFEKNRANRINFKCLSRYAGVFDEAEIYLSLDDTDDYDLIRSAEKVFISMPFRGNISFKVVKNTVYCESAIFKKEVVDKVDILDCLLFFAHAKGYTNLDTYPDRVEDLQKWIIGCYYLSLENVKEIENSIGPSSTCSEFVYGSFPIVAGKKIQQSEFKDFNKIFPGEIKYNWFYSGCFFWINTEKLCNFINVFSPAIPKMANRYFGERFFGNTFQYERNATGFGSMYLYPCNFYNLGVVSDSLKFILGDKINEFNNVYDEIVNSI